MARSSHRSPSRRLSPARRVAWRAALEAERRQMPAVEILDELAAAESPPLSARDRALALELLLGAIRHRASIDLVLATFSRQPLEKLDTPVREALRQGAYQLLFLERIPPHAAVNESVALGSRHSRSASGLINAVLRRTSELLDTRIDGPPAAEDRRRALAGRDGRTVLLKRPLLPAPEGWPSAWLAAHYSAPEWLAARLLERFGPEATRQILGASLTTPPLTVRINTQRAGPPPWDPDRIFAGADAAEPAGESSAAFRLKAPAVETLPGFGEGLFTVQDLTAQRPALLAAPAAGARVLDLCAAPGGKAMQLADQVGAQGKVLAVDVDRRRLDKVRENAARLGLGQIDVLAADAQNLPLRGGFDAVLLDAPCSNTGVMGRRVEVRWRLRPETFAEMAALQRRLLAEAAEQVRPGGTLVYSTCSIMDEENTAVVQSLLDARDDFTLRHEELTLPQAGLRDGGYAAKLVRAPGR